MGKELPKTGMDFAVLSELDTRSRFVLYCPMPWAPTITEELRNDLRFALGCKVGKKLRPLTDTERDMIAAAIRRAHPAVQLARQRAQQTIISTASLFLSKRTA
jgi:hypothetical protein